MCLGWSQVYISVIDAFITCLHIAEHYIKRLKDLISVDTWTSWTVLENVSQSNPRALGLLSFHGILPELSKSHRSHELISSPIPSVNSVFVCFLYVSYSKPLVICRVRRTKLHIEATAGLFAVFPHSLLLSLLQTSVEVNWVFSNRAPRCDLLKAQVPVGSFCSHAES